MVRGLPGGDRDGGMSLLSRKRLDPRFDVLVFEQAQEVKAPVIVEGRVRNYVFIRVRLHLAPGADITAVDRKAPFFREGIIRAAHQRPFTLQDDWQAIDTARLSAAVMHVAPRLVGPDIVVRVEVLGQTPRRRVSPSRT